MYTQSAYASAYLYPGLRAGCFHVHVKMLTVFRYFHHKIKLQDKKSTCRGCFKLN